MGSGDPKEDALAIEAKGEEGKAMALGIGYPRELLVELARQLAPRLESAAKSQILMGPGYLDASPRAVGQRQIEVVEEKLEETGGADNGADALPPQPAGSTAIVQRREDGITVSIPAAGVWKGSKGLFLFSIMWTTFSLLLGGFFLAVFLFGEDLDAAGLPIFFVAFIMSVLLLTGVLLLLGAINMGRRWTELATADDLLLVIRHTIFGQRTHQFSADQIASIERAPSGMEINNRPILELQIRTRDGGKFGMLSERDDEEIEWLAAELRRPLGIRRRG